MYEIRDLSEADLEGKAKVHYLAWNETYVGKIAPEYLETRTYERCLEAAKRASENTLVAIVDRRVVGFASYNQCRDHDAAAAGEINAIYVLRAFQGHGIGKSLMRTCIERLKDLKMVVIWVLRENEKAIGFYERMGFRADGSEKRVNLGNITTINEIRMIKKQLE